jgi:hypothetical protein
MPKLAVAEVAGKGRCVFAGERIAKGTAVTSDSVVTIPKAVVDAAGLPFAAYPFAWNMTQHCVALGLTSLANHDGVAPNCHVSRNLSKKLIGLIAKRDIEAGEEVTYDYKVPLWFEPQPPAKLGDANGSAT